jgi:SpoVK/Ycf46/Vps4 family AAA+-type ATPase
MRDLHLACKSKFKTVFLSSPLLNIPAECKKEIAILDLPLPSIEEIGPLFDTVCGGFKDLDPQIASFRDSILRSALGLSEDEIQQAFTKVLLGRHETGPDLTDKLYDEKRDIVRKGGLLDYIPPKVRVEEIGGLVGLKNWLRQRKRFFSSEAKSYGLDPPKGLLLTGISGCGKSMSVQAISTFWKMPMLRLDMNRVYGAIAGSPERSLEQAIKTAEAVSPCVLWIDEIETAIVGTHGTGEGIGVATRIFSSFLTWMQEKEHIVFVAATANEIDKLPPELLRKGRFDQIFFVDLPNEQERADIFSVHLTRRKQDPAKFDLVSLAKSTNNFNGAEIEQTILTAMYTAFEQNRPLALNDIYRSLGQIVPLATTMSERIKEIKRWADTRAIRANG